MSATVKFSFTLTLVLTALGAACLASLFFGSQAYSPASILAGLGGATSGPEASELHALIFGLRLPRTVLGFAVGAALGLAGALTQIYTHNPLADPGLLGITSGAGFGIVAGMALLGLTSADQYIWTGLLSATAAGALVLLLADRIPSLDATTSLILTGAVTGSLLGAATSAISLLNPEISANFQGWLTGSLIGRPLELLWVIGPFLLAGLVLTVINAAAWPSISLGDRLAQSHGRNVARDRLVGVAAIVLLAAAATALAGPVAFIGLLAPHLARYLAGGHAVKTVILAAPTGATLLILADTVGRLMLQSGELPVGITIALIGAPGFIFLARGAIR
ncbi:MAG: iron ABC transporter permease [Rothia sp. (in: high G+C Gram-positive bacteria)]|nr:iron ABC transporter permease [Rothia sp. (in: high G+C Gram-positive bacteria)]